MDARGDVKKLNFPDLDGLWSCTFHLLSELEAVPHPAMPPAAREPPTALLRDGEAGGHLGRVVR